MNPLPAVPPYLDGPTLPDAELEEQSLQRAAAIQQTRLETWRAAAIMTCLLGCGLPFGATALWLLRGHASPARESLQQLDRALTTGRRMVLMGTALSALICLLALVQIVDQLLVPPVLGGLR